MKNQLTLREKEILILILEEQTSQAIADALQLSIRTIDTHRKNILKKTKAKTHIGLFKYAIKAQLLSNYYYKPDPKELKNNTWRHGCNIPTTTDCCNHTIPAPLKHKLLTHNITLKP